MQSSIRDGSATKPVTSFLQKAFDSGEALTVPRGLFIIDGPINDTVGITLRGAGQGKSIFRLPDKNLNALCLRANNFDVSGLTVDLVNRDDKASGSAFLLFNTRGGSISDCSALNANRQGFTAEGAVGNRLSNISAYRCGHRGLNFSRGSSGNTIADFYAEGCGLSGMLFGFQSGGNKVRNVNIRRTEISPGLVVTFGSNGNIISNVTIRDPARDTEPHVEIGPACRDNHLSDFLLDGVNNRGILFRNSRFTEPYPNKLGIPNGPTTGNVLKRFRMSGTGAPRTVGVIFEDKDGLGIFGNRFNGFSVSGVTIGIEDRQGIATDNDFDNFSVGSDVRHPLAVPRGAHYRIR